MTARRWLRLALATVSLTSLGGCFYYPKSVTYFDPDCRIEARRLVLDAEQMGARCDGKVGAEGCLLILAGISATTAIVSGSIVIAGNTIHWLEKQGRCIARQ